MPDTAILLVNVGSPNSPKTKDVRQYLKQFLNNPRVIDIPAIPRWLLVNCIIAPFRAPKSAKLYKQLWTTNGAPLVYYALSVKEKLEADIKDADVFVGMNYGQPSISTALQTIKQNAYSRLIVLPLFPQYASSSTGAAIEAVAKIIGKWTLIPQLHIINQFYNHPSFIKALANRIKEYKHAEYDHILFSYHGLPVRHLQQMCTMYDNDECKCEQASSTQGKMCYKAACYDTTRLLAAELGIDKNSYSVGFQSRFSKNWMQPFTDKLIVAQARKGVKKMLVVAPSFVADCLETTIEIGYEYKKLFREMGGQSLQLVESLNDSPLWINALKEIVSL